MDRLTEHGRDVASGVVLLILALGYGVAALGIPSRAGEPGPGLVPIALAACLVALSAWVLVQGLRGARRRPTHPAPTDGGAAAAPGPATAGDASRERAPEPVREEMGPHGLRSGIAIALTLGYAAAFEPLGFLVSTLLYTGLLAALFTRRRHPMWIVPLATTLALYLFFRVALGVRLPPGIFD